jgi:S-adenosylmethionine:tRNA ribosyltransferase-isomerase
VHGRFDAIGSHLRPGDLLVVNTSATRPAALDATLIGESGSRDAVVHVSTELPGDLWLVEPRRRVSNGSTEPLTLPLGPFTAQIGDGGDAWSIDLLRPAPGSQRLWLAAADPATHVPTLLARLGRPIRYRYVVDDWPIGAYETVFGRDPGSAEMPSASRPFTADLVAELVRSGVTFATITLHTGVSSLEGHETPYVERFDVPRGSAELVNATRRAGGRVIAVGTTAVRAVETVAESDGTVHAGTGWTDTVVSPERGVRAVDGLVTGWHEPEASHLAMLEAIAGRRALQLAYDSALDEGYLWHEFGDSHLILPD